MGFLTDLVATIRRDLRDRPLDVARLRDEADARPPARPFAEALRAADRPAVIAEVKRASPSAGSIQPDADPAATAAAYAAGGAAAISVLTEPRHFRGSLDDLVRVREAVDLPLLRKDFVVDADQIVEARSVGADSILLIVACLQPDELVRLLGVSRSFGMEPLVETHSDEDLERALATDAAVIGVNARDLESLEVDVPPALARLRRIPRDRVAVLESGIRSHDDVAAAVASGTTAILVGETLMRAADPASAVRELLGTRTSAELDRRARA
jgi:indole-3-glycerol phosphate synthase